MSPSGPAHQMRTTSAGHLRGRDKHAPHLPRGNIAVLSLGALGVVYGDIGTSPLYAVNEIFFGHGRVAVTPENVRGCMSLVLWTLTIVVAFKYVVLVLRADNDGEGGIFALYGYCTSTSGTVSASFCRR